MNTSFESSGSGNDHPAAVNYLLHFSFKGTDFRGWQRQSSGRTVQETLENMLRRLTADPDLYLSGCSRTDAGVHALNMFATFRCAAAINPDFLLESLKKQCPRDIAVRSLQVKSPDFQLQNHIFGKSYIYAVYTGDYSLHLRDSCWSWPEKNLNLHAVGQMLKALEGTRDFRNFGGTANGVRSTIRTIYCCRMIAFGPVLCFYFAGNGFLHKMIRRIMGNLHELAIGNLSCRDFHDMLEYPENPAGHDRVAPPQGLYLKNIFFRNGDWRNDFPECPPFFQ